MANDSGATIDRRTLLKGLGAVSGAAVFGLPTISGTALGAPDVTPEAFAFYAITPSSDIGIDLKNVDAQYLIRIDPEDASTDVVAELNIVDEDLDLPLQAPSLAFHPDGTLYGVDINQGVDGQIFTVEYEGDGAGDVTIVGSKHDALKRMFGTAFTSDGVYHGINTGEDAFYSPIDYTESAGATDAPTLVGDTVDADTGVPIDVIHTGLAVNQATDTIFSTIGNQDGDSQDEVGIVDRNTGEIDIVAFDVFAVNQLVGAEFDPCTGELYAVRNGNQLLALDLATNTDRVVGTLSLPADLPEGTPVVTDNLAAMWVDCAAGCTRTIGYWKTHSCEPRGNNDDEIEPLLKTSVWLGTEGGEYSVEVTDSCEAQEILDVAGNGNGNGKGPGGSADLLAQLKAQLLAAKLNVRAGADQSEILEAVLAADEWLATDGSIDDEEEKEMVEEWKDVFDAYNNGYIGPGNCDEFEDDEEEQEEEEQEE